MRLAWRARVLLAAVILAAAACESARSAFRKVQLPHAPGSVLDKGDDVADRLVFTVDRRGRYFFRKPLPLAGVANEVRRCRRIARWKASARSEVEAAKASDLFVLIRADRRARWAGIVALIDVIEAEGLTRLQFGCATEGVVKPEPDFRLSQGPPSHKLAVPLAPSEAARAPTCTISLAVRADLGGGLHRVGRQRCAVLTAPGRMELQTVLCAVDALASGGVETFRFGVSDK